MPSVGSGIYLSGTGGQPFNSRGAYHQNPCPEVYLFSVRPRALRWPASDPRGVHRMLGRECRAVPVARLVLPATLMGYTVRFSCWTFCIKRHPILSGSVTVH